MKPIHIGILVEASLILVAFVLAHLFGVWEFQEFEFSVEGLLWGLGAGLLLLPFFWLTLRSETGPLSDIKDFLEGVLSRHFKGAKLWELFAISLVAGIGEEWLFRGVLQTVIGLQLGPLAGVLIASLLFGLCHWITRYYALIATLMGLFFGMLWDHTHNLLVPMLAHAVYDFLALVILRHQLRSPS